MVRSKIRSLLVRVLPFLGWWQTVNRQTLSSDLVAGFTGAVVVLPQGIAFATIAGLPPEYGLYSAIVPVVVAALFGSSHHLVSGPTTAISILVFSKISLLAPPFTDEYIRLALTLTFYVGVIQFAFGLARLGSMVNFVSHSVVVGFTCGAAILIATSQMGSFFGVSIPRGGSFLNTWAELFRSLSHTNLYNFTVALGTLMAAVLARRFAPRWPSLLPAMIFGSLVALVLQGKAHGLAYVGALPDRLPPFSLPDLSMDSLRALVPESLAVAMLGLAEAVSISRSIATKSHQRIDNHQEFIGQGLSNIVGSFFSSYASSGSFTRSGVNHAGGARTPLAAVFAALFLCLILLLVAPLTAYLPMAVMAGILVYVATGLIDLHHMRRIVYISRAESAVLVLTLLATLFLDLEFAIFAGVMWSLLLYLNRTSHPHFITIALTKGNYGHRFVDLPDAGALECPQIKLIRIDGSIFFGAVNHISEELHQIASQNPDQKHIVIIGSGINFIDVTGCEMLFEESRNMHMEGRELYLCSIKEEVMKILSRSRCARNIGRVFASKNDAVEGILPLLDQERCRSCSARVFLPCEARPGATQGDGPG